MQKISENEIDLEMLDNIEGCANDAATLLGRNVSDPEEEIVNAIDDFVSGWQKGERPGVPEDDDLSLILGSLWGQQLVRKLGWQWASVTFLDHDDSQAVGVFSLDRVLAIYPVHFVYGCMENQAIVTIGLSFKMLVEGSRIPPLPKNGYENVMDHVHPIIPPK